MSKTTLAKVGFTKVSNEANLIQKTIADSLMRFLPKYQQKVIYEDLQPTKEASLEVVHGAVLFADLSGFTALTNAFHKLGPVGAEAMTRCLNEVFSNIIVVVDSFGGDIIKFAGDAILVLFGASVKTKRRNSLSRKNSKGKIIVKKPKTSTAEATQGDIEQTEGEIKKKAIKRACAVAVQCAMKLLKEKYILTVERDKLALPPKGLEQVNSKLDALSMHIGIGAGTVNRLIVGGQLDRWEIVCTGAPMDQLATSVSEAQKGEVCVHKNAYRYITDIVDDTKVIEETGNVIVKSLKEILENNGQTSTFDTSKNEKDTEDAASGGTVTSTSAATSATDTINYDLGKNFHVTDAMHKAALKDAASLLPAVKCFVPGAVRQLYRDEAVFQKSNRLLEEITEIRSDLTIVFANFPAVNVNDGTESLQQIQNVLTQFQRICYYYEGSLNKCIVDDKGVLILAAFGLPPFSHVDDSIRALRFAIALRKSIKRKWQKSLIGVTTGSCFCGMIGSKTRGEYTLISDHVNMAARLMGISSSYNGILCDTRTKELTETNRASGLKFKGPFSVKVKGKIGKMDVYAPEKISRVEVERKKQNVSHKKHLIPIVGRKLPLKRILSAAEQLQTNQKSECVVLQGEEGIGKTRIVEETIEQIQQMNSDWAMNTGDMSTKRYIKVFLGAAGSCECKVPMFAWYRIFCGILGLDNIDMDKRLQEKADRINLKTIHKLPSQTSTNSDNEDGNRSEATTQKVKHFIPKRAATSVLIRPAKEHGKMKRSSITEGPSGMKRVKLTIPGRFRRVSAHHRKSSLQNFFNFGESERESRHSNRDDMGVSFGNKDPASSTTGLQEHMVEEIYKDKYMHFIFDLQRKKYDFVSDALYWTSGASLLSGMLGIKMDENISNAKLKGRKRLKKQIDFMVNILRARATESPIMLVLDNAHWLDPSSMSVVKKLTSLIKSGKVKNIVLLLVLRPFMRRRNSVTKIVQDDKVMASHTSSQIESSFRNLRKWIPEWITVSPMFTEEISEMVQSILKVKVIPQEVLDLIVMKAHGNPYFCISIVQHMLEVNAIRIVEKDADDEDGKCVDGNGDNDNSDLNRNKNTERVLIIGDFNEEIIPDDLKRVVSAKIDYLDIGDKSVLKTASVFGIEFTFDHLMSVLPLDMAEECRKSLLLLLSKQFISKRDAAGENDDTERGHKEEQIEDMTFYFHEPLIRDVAYSLLSFYQKRALHQKIGELLSQEKFEEDDDPAFLSIIGDHFLRAGIWRKGIALCASAGELAMKNGNTMEGVLQFKDLVILYNTNDEVKSLIDKEQMENWKKFTNLEPKSPSGKSTATHFQPLRRMTRQSVRNADRFKEMLDVRHQSIALRGSRKGSNQILEAIGSFMDRLSASTKSFDQSLRSSQHDKSVDDKAN
eukprot:g4237.t1